MVDDDLARQAGHLIELFLHGDAFHDVAERHPPADFGEDREGVRVPLDESLTHGDLAPVLDLDLGDRKSTRLNSSHSQISYAVFCLKKKKKCRHDMHSTT